MPASRLNRRPALYLFLQFFKLGLLAAGGPTAHIAMMDREFVERKGWLDQKRFLDLLTLSYLVPGPNSTMMAMNIGYVRQGALGVWLAGLGFILPGTVIALVIAWLYVAYGHLPETQALFWGLQAVAIAIIVDALRRLLPRAVTDRFTIAVFLAGLILAYLKVDILLIVSAAALLGLLRAGWRQSTRTLSLALPMLLAGLASIRAVAQQIGDSDGSRLPQLGWAFLRTALILFDGSLFIAYVQPAVVDRYGWLTDQQLLDAVAIGQAVPGPVLKSSGVIGYFAAGWPGAAVALTAIFLPSFIFAMLLGHAMPRLNRSTVLLGMLATMLPAVLASMVLVTLNLAWPLRDDLWQLTLLGLSAVVLMRFRVDAVWVLLGGGLVGFLWQGGILGA
jgi:chromate transporter